MSADKSEDKTYHCHNGSSCLLGAKSQGGGDGCWCGCDICLGIAPNDDDTEADFDFYDDERSRKPKGKKLHKFPHKQGRE